MPHQNRDIKKLREAKKNCSIPQNNRHHETANAIQVTQEQLDVIVIDLTLRELFNDGDKKVVDFKTEIIEKYNIPQQDNSYERYWDILDATQLVNPVVGFGNANKLNLTSQGYSLMMQFGSYQNYLNTMTAHQAVAGSSPTDNTAETTTSETVTDVKEIKPAEGTGDRNRKRDDKTF